jgi:hypothetical protein
MEGKNIMDVNLKEKYDILIDSAGLSGSIIAKRFGSQSNLKVLIIDKRNHIGDNCYDYIDENYLTNYYHIYVGYWESPCIRHLFAYGALKPQAKNIYPKKFTFGKFSGEQPKMNNILDYDLIITSDLFKLGFNDKWTLKNGDSYLYIQKQ